MKCSDTHTHTHTHTHGRLGCHWWPACKLTLLAGEVGVKEEGREEEERAGGVKEKGERKGRESKSSQIHNYRW